MSEFVFKPECLTISPGNDCNLGCSYCYAKLFIRTAGKVSEDDYIKIINSSAQIVAENCSERKIPFNLGFQGGGEPLLYYDQLKKICRNVLEIAEKSNLKLFSFITSNGTMEPEKYLWLAENFSRICISVDGPEHIHNHNRKFKDGSPVFQRVKKNIEVLSAAGNNPVCRMTITEDNIEYLAESVRYLVSGLGFSSINIEPVYSLYETESIMFDPELFADSLVNADRIASGLGCSLTYSGFRPAELHGAYCNTEKKVLFITPNGKGSICLFNENDENNNLFTIGEFLREKDTFIIDHEKVEKLQSYINLLPEECTQCVIKNHCTRGCPDICLIKMNSNIYKKSVKESMRCRVNRALYNKGFGNAGR